MPNVYESKEGQREVQKNSDFLPFNAYLYLFPPLPFFLKPLSYFVPLPLSIHTSSVVEFRFRPQEELHDLHQDEFRKGLFEGWWQDLFLFLFQLYYRVRANARGGGGERGRAGRGGMGEWEGGGMRGVRNTRIASFSSSPCTLLNCPFYSKE